MNSGRCELADRSMCETCLSQGRRVAPLGSLRREYAALLECRARADPLVCWECAALLKAARQFRRRAAHAEVWLRAARLSGDERPDAKSVSSLKITEPTVLLEIIPPCDSRDHKVYDIDFSFDRIQRTENDEHTKLFIKFEVPKHEEHSKTKNESKNKQNATNKVSAPKHKLKIQNVQRNLKSKVDKCEKNISFDKYENIADSMGAREKRGRGRPASKMKIRILKASEVEGWREKERNRESFLSAKYKCVRCILILKEDTYASHVASLHKSKTLKWRCDICKLQFETKLLLSKHISTHFKLYSCTRCSLSGINARSMYNHYNIHHVLKRAYNCSTCSATFTQWIKFREHLKGHKKTEKENVFVCDKCGKKYATRAMIKKHLRTHEKYMCAVCERTYVSKSNLHLHYQRKHTAAPVPSEVYCVECNKQYHTVLSFEGHLSTVHSSKVKVRVPCTACNMTFANKSAFKQHYNFNHLKVTEFHCGPCDKYFYSNDSLHYHKKRVHDHVPLPKNRMCTICGRGFSSKKILVNHIRTHTGERPYECEHCNAAFAQRSAWKQHLKRVHQRVEKNAAKDCA